MSYSEAEFNAQCEYLRGLIHEHREAIKTLLDCGNTIIGARTDDPDAAEAFDMYNDARTSARRLLAGGKS